MGDKPTVGGAALGQHAVRFEGLLEAMPDALVGVDRAGVIRFVNRQAEALFGYERGELVGWLIVSPMLEAGPTPTVRAHRHAASGHFYVRQRSLLRGHLW